MGCGSHKNIQVTPGQQTLVPTKFNLVVENPHTRQNHQFSITLDYESVQLSEIMNGLQFDPVYQDDFDANFMSMLSTNKEEYIYYVQRLMGIEIENDKNPLKGKMWVVYINNKKEDWNFICDKNRVVTKNDEILWRYESNTIQLSNQGTTNIGSRQEPF